MLFDYLNKLFAFLLIAELQLYNFLYHFRAFLLNLFFIPSFTPILLHNFEFAVIKFAHKVLRDGDIFHQNALVNSQFGSRVSDH